MNRDTQLRPELAKLQLDNPGEAYALASVIRVIHVHTRSTGRAPAQGDVSQAFALDKRKGIAGCAGMRLLHCFCPWWRTFHRHFLTVDGGGAPLHMSEIVGSAKVLHCQRS